MPFTFYPTPYETPEVPYMTYPEYPGLPNYLYMPGAIPYNVPMGIPLLPLYGYDNAADMDRDIEYMKQLYPETARKLQFEIDNECDKLEYDGSAMFDEYPDRTFIDRIVDRIYDKMKDEDDEAQVEMQNMYGHSSRRRGSRYRDLITLLLLGEIFNRRRRFRSRRNWF
jgi:hypothetical protein